MWVTVDHARIYVEQQGQGEPALLLHGVPDSAELWAPVMAGIQHRYTCYAPDLPGFYRSQVPPGFRFDLSGYADFVAHLLDELGLQEPVTLILHDWGGIFGMAFACAYPERVARIVGGSFPFSHLYRWHPWARIWQTPMLGELSMRLMNRQLFAWEVRRGSRRLSHQQICAMYDGRVTSDLSRRTVLRLYRSAAPRRFLMWQARLQRLARQVPVDLIWGRDDPYIPTFNADLLHARSKVLLEHCGHWVPAEAPEALIDLILHPPAARQADDEPSARVAG